MNRYVFLIGFCLIPLSVQATEAPPGQVHLTQSEILRGQFAEEQLKNGASIPLQTSGHFTIAPANGLLWGIEQPFPTTTIVTANGIAQDLGGMTVKLPAKNMGQLYHMIGGALGGDWQEVENNFTITRSGTEDHWQMLLVPRAEAPRNLASATVTVTGSHFVETIALHRTDGSYDNFTFTNEALSPAPATPKELKLFANALR